MTTSADAPVDLPPGTVTTGQHQALEREAAAHPRRKRRRHWVLKGLAILVLLALVERDSMFIDVALGLAALGFISIIALAKYLADEQMY